jgi:hypothetical protein
MQARRQRERGAAFKRLRTITADWRKDQQPLGVAISDRARVIGPAIAAAFNFALDVHNKDGDE